MAHTVHLTLKGPDGQIEGESSQVDMGRENTIECVHLESGVTNPRTAGKGQAAGKRQFAPLKIRKRIDKASPMLMQALCHNTALEGVFQFFRPTTHGNMSKDSEEVFYTISIGGAYISDIKLVVPDTLDSPGASTAEAYEDVSFTFDSIKWEHIPGKKDFQDSWSGSH